VCPIQAKPDNKTVGKNKTLSAPIAIFGDLNKVMKFTGHKIKSVYLAFKNVL
jgi:hypothetical protein